MANVPDHAIRIGALPGVGAVCFDHPTETLKHLGQRPIPEGFSLLTDA